MAAKKKTKKKTAKKTVAKKTTRPEGPETMEQITFRVKKDSLTSASELVDQFSFVRRSVILRAALAIGLDKLKASKNPAKLIKSHS